MTIADLIFTQATLKIVRDTVASRPETSLFGLLLGEIQEDPTCARPWVRVNRVVHGPAISGDPSAASLSEITDGLIGGLEDPRPVVGWYRSHPGAGLYLSPEEAIFHETRFADPWGFAVVLVGDAARLTGSVFQRTVPEGLSRSVYTPFYELVHDSSEFNGTTKRTYVSWPNYQTETRVVQAGQGSVSAQIPDGSKALVTVAPTASTEDSPAREIRPAEEGHAVEKTAVIEPVEPLESVQAVGSSPAAESVGAVASSAPEQSAADSQVEWEKKQIQRSLTAVGRSIGSTALGGLDTPVTVDREPRTAEDDTALEKGGAPEAEGMEGRPGNGAEPPEVGDEAESHTVVPIRPDNPRGGGPEAGFVGRARRQRVLPFAKLLSAAAAVILLMGASWFSARMMRGQGNPTTDGEGGTPTGSAVAGLGLSPAGLFKQEAAPDPLDTDTNAVAPEEIDTSFVSIGPPTVFASENAATVDEHDEERSATAPGPPVEPRPAETRPRPRPPEPQIVEAPELSGIEMDDPQVSAFKNALEIFRMEVQRYEEVRSTFDSGESSCNPLNLALRGVHNSFGRLDTRFQAAAEGLAGQEVRSFEGARRQTAMLDTHYGLTECPASPGASG